MSATLLWRWGPSLLLLGVLLTRLPFMTSTLYAWDSANYALAVRDYYNVAHHQPQPPGYPLYVFFGKLLYLLVGDANRALVLLSVILSCIAVASTRAVAAALFGRGVGLLAGLLLLFTVGFWGYGEVAYPYVALAAETSTIAYLAHRVLAGHRRSVVWLALAAAISLGVRWDGAVFGSLLGFWALAAVSWRLRLAAGALGLAVVTAFAVPMVVLTGGPDVYLRALDDYLRVWAPQSAYVVGEFSSGQAAQANFNLNFFVNYSRQMLGVGLVLLLYVVGRRLGPARLATDYRSRFLLLWIVPPILTYLFTHLGEPGYVLSLAPAAATITALAAVDLGQESRVLAQALRGRGWRWVPRASLAGAAVTTLILAAVLGWNVQAFLRGVGPGRLPDLRGRDAINLAHVGYLRQQAPGSTLALAHDSMRQVQFYLPGYPVQLLYTPYVPNWETVRTTTPLPPGVTQVAVLDAPIQVPAEDRGRAQEVVLSESPRVTITVLDVQGASAVEHGYRFVRVVP